MRSAARRTARGLGVLLLATLSGPGLPLRAADDAPAPRIAVQRRHGGTVTGLAFTPDGRFLLSGAGDDTAMLWDTEAWHLVRRFPAGTGGAVSVALSADARHALVAGGDAPEARLYETVGGQELARPTARSGRFTALGTTEDGETFVVGDDVGALHVFSARRPGRARQRLTPHARPIRALQVVERLRSVFTASDDGTVCRTLLSGRGETRYGDDAGGLAALAVARDADVVVAGSVEGALRVWDADTPDRPRRVLHVESGGLRGVAVSPDGRVVYAVDSTSRLTAWDVAGETKKRYEVQVGTGSPLSALALSPDGRRLVAGHESGEIRVLDAETGEAIAVPGEGTAVPRSVQFSADGHWLAVGVDDGRSLPRVDLYDLDAGRRLAPRTDGNGVSCFAVSPDGFRMAIGAFDGVVRLWDLTRREIVRSLPRQDTAIGALAWVDARRIVTGAAKGAVVLWDAEDGREIRRFPGHEADIRYVASSPRGDRMLTISIDRQARLWNLETGAEVRLPEGLPNPLAPAFTPDGARIVVRLDDLTIGVLDAAKGRLLETFPEAGRRRGEAGHTQAITCLAVTPDGRRVVTGSWDKSLRVWNLDTGRVERVLEGHEDDVLGLAISPDGRHLASTGADFLVRLWDLGEGRALGTIAGAEREPAAPEVPGGLPAEPHPWIVFDPHGRFDAEGIPALVSVNWVSGLDTFALSDLSADRRDPALLAKILGRSPITPRPVADLPPPAPPPSVEVEAPPPGSATVAVEVVNRGGGIGPVGVRLNGREIVEDARGETVAADAPREDLAVDLSRAPNLLPGEANTVEVRAYDAKRTSQRRGRLVVVDAPGTPLGDPEMHAVVCGVSDYAGASIDLGFPARDAAVFAEALRLAAGSHFGEDRTHVRLLASPAPDGAEAATRANLLAALEEVVASTKANDVVCVYLAGHGVVTGTAGDEKEYRYLLADAGSTATDASALAAASLSGRELADALARVRANHRALFLDTCAAGEVRDTLRGTPASSGLPEATVHRLRDREGVFVLAGCAADRVSYESSIYGQGLLTYALLYGMSCGCHFKDGVYVDVGRLMGFACDLVPAFSRQMGLAPPQIPVKAEGDVPFSLGRLDETARARIPVAQPVPGLVRSSFQRQSPPTDVLGLSPAVDLAVRSLNRPGGARAPVAFVETDRMTGAHQLAGRYTIRDGTATVEVYLLGLEGDRAADREIARFEVSGPCEGDANVAALADAVVARAVQELGAR